MKSAFNFIINLKGNPNCTIERYDEIAPVPIKLARSNYFKNFDSIEQMSISGHQFVVSKADLDKNSYPAPQRGDAIEHPDLGTISVSEVKVIEGLAGEIYGYRLGSS